VRVCVCMCVLAYRVTLHGCAACLNGLLVFPI